MGFPDRIERTVELAHPPATVWAAITTAEGLGTWFGNEATIDLRPGGAARMKWDHGYAVDMRVLPRGLGAGRHGGVPAGPAARAGRRRDRRARRLDHPRTSVGSRPGAIDVRRRRTGSGRVTTDT